MTGLYRALLRLYPTSFRRSFGDEMTRIFEERARDEGSIGRLRLLLAAVPDVVGNALALHAELLLQDLHHATRSLRRAPAFAGTVVLVTGLGVGANTAAFSVADFALTPPLPFPDSESLVRICGGPRQGGGWGCNNQVAPATFRDYQEQASSFEALGAFQREAVNLVGVAEPVRLAAARLTPEVLPLLGVAPLLGATGGEGGGEARQGRSVVLGHGLWQSHFAGDASILGRSVSLDGEPYTVTAVMPRSFHFPTRDVQLWTTLELTAEDFEDPFNNYLEAVGRLGSGVTFEAARAELVGILERLRQARPDVYEDEGLSFFRIRDEFSPRFRLMLEALIAASLCMLVLACANIASLTLARRRAREQEMAVRAALGAGRERLARHLATETLALVLVGGAAGVLIGVLALPLLSLLVPPTLPIADRPEVDLRMLALGGLFTALIGLGFGFAPALAVRRRDPLHALGRGLRSAAGPGQRHRAVLVSVQIAASVVLLVSSGLLVRAALRVQAIDPGFRPEGAIAFSTVLPKPEYMSLARRDRFYQEVLSRVRALPRVEAAAYTSGLPMVLTGGITRVVLPGEIERPGGDDLVSRRYVTPQLFAALGVPLLAGRDLEDGDAADSATVAVVSRSFASRYWPDQGAVGQSFVFQNRLHTVVGVVGDIRVRGLERESEPQMYLPSSWVGEGPVSIYDLKDLVVRTGGSPAALLPAIRDIIRDVDPDQPISSVMTLTELVELQTASRRAQVRVLAVLAGLALLLAGVGIYGLLAYLVAQRHREIGVRMALGEEPGRIAARVVWEGLRLVLIGLGPGLLLSYWAAHSMRALLFGIAPADPATLGVVAAICLGSALLGASGPALRAMRVSPVAVIRSE